MASYWHGTGLKSQEFEMLFCFMISCSVQNISSTAQLMANSIAQEDVISSDLTEFDTACFEYCKILFQNLNHIKLSMCKK